MASFARVALGSRVAAPIRFVKVADGRQVAIEEFGAQDGVPVFFFHGWPSSRTMAELTDDAAKEQGVRMISLDRPGIRDSTFHPRRTLLDWPALMQEVADHLRLQSFRVLAISGGAPYAYVTGWSMPERARALAIVSGAPPIAELEDRAGLFRLHRWMLELHAARPTLLRRLFRVARPFAAAKLSFRFRPFLRVMLQRLDAEALRDSRAFEACFESSRLAWRASAEGVATDAEIYAKPWGFPLEDVKVPVRLWHGTKDRTFARELAEDVAARLPNCALRIIEGAGHYSLPIRHVREILADLIAA